MTRANSRLSDIHWVTVTLNDGDFTMHDLHRSSAGIYTQVEAQLIFIKYGCLSLSVWIKNNDIRWNERKEENVLFNDALNTFCIYGYIASEETRCCHPTDRIAHTTAFVTPVVEHWLEREIAHWVHYEGSIRRPIASWTKALTTELHFVSFVETLPETNNVQISLFRKTKKKTVQ